MWLQQDDATCHNALITMDLLRGKFGEHFISPSGPIDWPPRSCALTLIDHFLWGYDKPASFDALEDNIEAFIREILAKMLERVCHNWTKRMDYLRCNRGQH